MLVLPAPLVPKATLVRLVLPVRKVTLVLPELLAPRAIPAPPVLPRRRRTNRNHRAPPQGGAFLLDGLRPRLGAPSATPPLAIAGVRL